MKNIITDKMKQLGFLNFILSGRKWDLKNIDYFALLEHAYVKHRFISHETYVKEYDYLDRQPMILEDHPLYNIHRKVIEWIGKNTEKTMQKLNGSPFLSRWSLISSSRYSNQPTRIESFLMQKYWEHLLKQEQSFGSLNYSNRRNPNNLIPYNPEEEGMMDKNTLEKKIVFDKVPLPNSMKKIKKNRYAKI